MAALIVIDDPAGMYYGGEIAAPVFNEIMSQIMRYLAIRPQDDGTLLPPAKPADAKEQLPHAGPTSEGPPPVVPPGQVLVPALNGKTIRETGDELHRLGLTFVPVGTGTAVKQNISPNTPVKPGTEVIVYFEPK